RKARFVLAEMRWRQISNNVTMPGRHIPRRAGRPMTIGNMRSHGRCHIVESLMRVHRVPQLKSRGAEDISGTALQAVTYIAQGDEDDRNPSLRYLTLLREGARVHGLPEHYIRFLEQVEHAR